MSSMNVGIAPTKRPRVSIPSSDEIYSGTINSFSSCSSSTGSERLAKSSSSTIASSSEKPPKKAKFNVAVEKYSLDDLRRLTNKLLDLGVLNLPQLDNYVQDATWTTEDRVLCTYDTKVQWRKYDVKNQEFNFPDFMPNPVYLSRGGFGTVVKCLRYGEPVAVKKVQVPDHRHREMALRLLRELVIMKQAKKVKQRSICKIIDIFGDPTVKCASDLESIYIVMPLYWPGSLDMVKVNTPAMFKTIAGHTLSALHFLHRHKIMHRDIKKENIFYDESRNRAYLADLGQARTWNEKRMSGNGTVGTRCYVSPEILQGFHYDFRSDVYSLGQAWYETLCLTADDSLYPWSNSGGKEHILMQKAMDPVNYKARTAGDPTPFAAWADEKWEDLEEKAEEWEEPALTAILELMLLFDHEKRADTHRLFEIPYFFSFISNEAVIDLREVEKASYSEIKQRIFELQHGNCASKCSTETDRCSTDARKKLTRQCSRAVQYFVDENNEFIDL